MAELKDILTDPDFKAASPETKRSILMQYDPDFAQATLATQNAIIGQLNQPAGGMIERAYSAVAKPLTQALGTAISAGFVPPHELGAAIAGIKPLSPNPIAQKVGQVTSEFLIPQTPAQALATAITPLGRTPMGRIGLGGLSGAAGGAMGPEGAVGGALQMGGGAAAGETVSGILGLIARSAPGAKGLINQQDTKRLLGWMEDTIPALRGRAGDAQQLQELAKGSGGRQALSEYFRDSMNTVENQIGNRVLDVPSLDPSRMLTFKEATEKLADLGNRGFGGAKGDPNTRTIVGREAREQWVKAVTEMEPQIEQFGGPRAVREFFDGRENYSKGLAFLSLLRRSEAFVGYPQRVDLNTRALQGRVSNKQSMMENRFSPDEYAELVNVVFRGGRVGTKDRLAPGPGGLTDALRDVYGRGIGGAPQFLGSLLRTALPNVGSQYAGRTPLSVTPDQSALLDLLLQRGLGPQIQEAIMPAPSTGTPTP